MTRAARGAPASTKAGLALRGYLARSHGLAESLLAIAPLVALYEAGLAVTRAPVANGADVLLRRAFLVVGPELGVVLWWSLLAAAMAAAAFVAVRERLPVFRDLPLLALEGLAYGALLGPLALWIERRLVAFLAVGGSGHGLAADIALSLGAGVWEEIVFRLLVLSACYFVARRSLGPAPSDAYWAAGLAVLASSLAFSGFHHWPGGEPFHWRTFLFRSIAGAVLGVLFVARGLGVAVYTHAAYDLLVTLSA